MAEESENGEKSEAPSGRRIGQARGDGMVGRSMDLSQIMGMTAAFVAMQYLAPVFWEKMIILLKGSFTSKYSTEKLTLMTLRFEFLGLIWFLLPHLLLLMFIAAFFGVGCTLLQTKFLWSWKLVKPKWRFINPIAGLKRIVSIYNVINFGKALLKLCIIGPLGYYAFIDYFPQLLGLMNIPLQHLFPFAGVVAAHIFFQLAKFLFVLGVCDLAWQKWSTYKKLKMTKHEVKDEKKSIEGDEETKMQMKGKSLARIRQRLLSSVPKADVVVTNPTHLAVALQYNAEDGGAPEVVAKGRGHMAFKIREIARQHGIPVVERKPLARALFKSVEVGQKIPYELYAAVAEILAYVYRVKGKNPFKNKPKKKKSEKKSAARGRTRVISAQQ